MSAARPELIFVSGPQTGERAVLMGNIAVGGRSPDADVQMNEQYVSRQQVRFTLTREGWMVENVAKNPIGINGKKFKAGKRIILDTGDVLAVGMETEVLFVAPGDDPEQALAAFRAEQAESQSQPLPAAAEAITPARSAESESSASVLSSKPVSTAEEAPPEEEKKPAEETEEQQLTATEIEAAKERRAKLKKYATYGVVYLGLLIGAVYFLVRFKGTTNTVSSGPPKLMSDEQIRQILSEPITDKPYYEAAAAEYLEKAQIYYRDARIKPGNLYKAVKYFKLHLAFRRAQTFPTPKLEREYNLALGELIQQLTDKYKGAYVLEKNGSYQQARDAFEELRRMIPAKEDPEPETENKLFDNVVKHITYVCDQIEKNRKRKR